jgi:hypothetical protein
MRRPIFFAVASLILGASCTTTTACDCITPNPAVDEEFELAPLGAAAIKGTNLFVRFDSVTSDSRCASDVMCIWAGNAAIQIVMTNAGVEKFNGRINTAVEPRSVVLDGYELVIVAITPVPKTGTTIMAKDYRARLKLSSK